MRRIGTDVEEFEITSGVACAGGLRPAHPRASTPASTPRHEANTGFIAVLRYSVRHARFIAVLTEVEPNETRLNTRRVVPHAATEMNFGLQLRQQWALHTTRRIGTMVDVSEKCYLNLHHLISVHTLHGRSVRSAQPK